MKTTVFLSLVFSFFFIPSPAHAQFYYPDKVIYGTPDKQGLKYETVTFTSKDGTKLAGWFIPTTRAVPLGTVIHFHGNAQNMTAHFSYVSWLPKAGFNVFVFDYRGYGTSEGVPSREGIYQDSLAALRYITSRKDIQQDQLLVFGQSLGGAIAVAAVASGEFEGIRAVVIESAFYSYKTIAADKAPQGLVDLLVGDEHSPGPLIPKLAPIPLLVIHGTKDGVVPYAHGQRLFKEASQPKALWTITNGKHVEAFSTYGRTYQLKLIDYFKICLAKPLPKKE